MSPTLSFTLANGLFVRIQAVAEHTFRIRASKSPDFPESPLVRYGILSASEEPAGCRIEEFDCHARIRSEHASLDIDMRDGTFVLSRPDGTILTASAAPPRSGPDDGFEAQFRLTEAEKWYGLGDKAKDRIQIRGLRAAMRTAKDGFRVPIPFMMSSRGWALLVNSTRPHTVDIGHTVHDRLTFGGSEGTLDYYVIAGESLGTLLDRYTGLSGRPALLPLWAYGLTFIANQYATARDVIEDGLNFRRGDIPCDMIGLEPGWMATMRDYSTNKQWHPERFAIPSWNPKGPRTFMGALDRMGFKLSLWLCCNHDVSRQEERRLAGRTAADPEASEDWYTHLEKFVEQGAAAFKLEAFPFEDRPELEWANGMSTDEMHHLYNLLLCKQIFGGYVEQTGRRPLVYCAKGYAGIQQYAVTWTGYQYVNLIELLNQNMSGNINALTDMEVHAPSGIHFGFLQTLAQVNSWAYWQHPTLLDPDLMQMFRMYAKLRYRLIPYLYSAAHTAARTGLPVMRAMTLMFPDDPRSDGLLEQYMLGDAFLVGLADRIYLPEGQWIDYWTGMRYAGPLELSSPVPAHAGGYLFVRDGSIIPVWPEVSHVGSALPERIGIELYPRASNAYALYEDDGVTYEYRKHKFSQTSISFATEEERLVIRLGPRVGEFTGMPEKRTYALSVHAESEPFALLVNGVPLSRLCHDADRAGTEADGWEFDRDSSVIRLCVAEDPGKGQVRIEIDFAADGDKAAASGKERRGTNQRRFIRPTSDNPLIRQVLNQLDESLDQELTLNVIAERLHVNSSHLSRLFKRETGFSFSAYVLDLKMDQAAQLLIAKRKIGDIAEWLGFTDASHFVRVFRKYWGVTPGKWSAP
ncbi:TIM-barrel domain-containing protein [Paenibacillus hodogayensis]|uniref:TIM-barrel domain-containing protein n=1 Tax=Paenibacillus hodogayensis TaxID=279208 RepID=A0ABV5W0I0_9BACL